MFHKKILPMCLMACLQCSIPDFVIRNLEGKPLFSRAFEDGNELVTQLTDVRQCGHIPYHLQQKLRDLLYDGHKYQFALTNLDGPLEVTAVDRPYEFRISLPDGLGQRESLLLLKITSSIEKDFIYITSILPERIKSAIEASIQLGIDQYQLRKVSERVWELNIWNTTIPQPHELHIIDPDIPEMSIEKLIPVYVDSTSNLVLGFHRIYIRGEILRRFFEEMDLNHIFHNSANYLEDFKLALRLIPDDLYLQSFSFYDTKIHASFEGFDGNIVIRRTMDPVSKEAMPYKITSQTRITLRELIEILMNGAVLAFKDHV